MTYVSERAKQNLAKYSYTGHDASIIAPYFQPFWNWSVTKLPLWMAPNLVTFLGFVAMLIGFAVQMYHSPNLREAAPSWVYYLSAVTLFIYQTMDAIDGKQARRTGSSSAMGELFDHGCDALVTMFQALSIAATIQLGGSWWTWAMLTGVHIAAYVSIWEEYHTDVLRFGMFNSPTEAIVTAMLLHVGTGFFGAHFWTTNVAEKLGFASVLPSFLHLQVNQLFVLVGFVGAAQLIYGSFDHVLQFVREKAPRKLETVLASGVPFVFLYVNYFAWIALSPSNISIQYPLFMYAIFGTLAGYVVSRIILVRVLKEEAEHFFYILAPLPLGAINALSANFSSNGLPFVDELTFAIGYAVVIVLFYAHFIHHVINDICNHLNIHLFRLKAKNKN